MSNLQNRWTVLLNGYKAQVGSLDLDEAMSFYLDELRCKFEILCALHVVSKRDIEASSLRLQDHFLCVSICSEEIFKLLDGSSQKDNPHSVWAKLRGLIRYLNETEGNNDVTLLLFAGYFLSIVLADEMKCRISHRIEPQIVACALSLRSATIGMSDKMSPDELKLFADSVLEDLDKLCGGRPLT